MRQFPGQATSTPRAPTAVTPATTSPEQAVRDALTTAGPVDVYRAFREAREVIEDRIGDLQERREEIVQQIREGSVSDTDKAGLDGQLAQVDQQIASAYIQLAEAEQKVVAAASVPGATVDPPEENPWQYGPPEEVVMMGIFFSFVLLMPFAIAWARRVWRRSAKVEVTLPPQLVERMESLERSMDTVAVEVERIGEGQRFVTQLLADRAKAAALPAERSGGAGSGRPA